MLSVIVCTYNRQKYIYNCLKSIANGKLEATKYEVILINNNSSDTTEEECGRFKDDFPCVNFKYFVEMAQGLSFARNRGIEEASGDVLIYVDDDATVNDEYLETVYNFFSQNPNAMAAGGAITPVYETEEPSWMSFYTKVLITAYKNEGDNIIELKGGKFPSGGNVAYRKEVFQQVGLFNTELGRKGSSLIGAEEKAIFDKVKALGMPVFYLPKMILYHIIPASKLTNEYFDNLTISMGKSEKIRTLTIGKGKYLKRLLSEMIKWSASILLCIGFCIRLSHEKGGKLIRFRYNVTKGLFSKIS